MDLLQINPRDHPDRFVCPSHRHNDAESAAEAKTIPTTILPRLVKKFRRSVVWLTRNRSRRPDRKWLCPWQGVPVPVVTCVRLILDTIPSLTPSLPTSVRRSVLFYESKHVVRVTLSCFRLLHYDRCVALLRTLRAEEPQLTISCSVSLVECLLVFDIAF